MCCNAGLALAVSLAVATPRLAPGQSLGGRLVDRATRGAIEGVSVALVDTANKVIARAVSDTLGEFILDASAAGRYRLRFLDGSIALGESEEIAVREGDFHQRLYVLEVTGDLPVYLEFQVARQVAPLPGNVAPLYPSELRERSIEGDVLMQFVVDTAGRLVPGTLRALRSTDPAFTREVVRALMAMRFLPAELKDGTRVRQFVQMPFQFRLSRH